MCDMNNKSLRRSEKGKHKRTKPCKMGKIRIDFGEQYE